MYLYMYRLQCLKYKKTTLIYNKAANWYEVTVLRKYFLCYLTLMILHLFMSIHVPSIL